MTRQDKQNIINNVTDLLRNRQWFNGAGFEPNSDELIIAYNFYPAFDLVWFKDAMLRYNVTYSLKDIRVVRPGSQKDDVPPYIK